MRLPALLMLVVLPGCGRLGFEPGLAADGGVNPAPDDAALEDAAQPIDAARPGLLGCVGSREPLLASGLAGYWAFNDGAQIVTDSSPTGAHGSFESELEPPLYVPGVVGTGMAFDGVSTAAVVPGALLSEQPLDGDFSVDAWILPGECAELGTIIGRGGITGPGFAVHCKGAELSFEVLAANGSLAVLVTTFGDPGVWHHVAALRRGADLELYIDGLKHQKAIIEAIDAPAADADLYIGRYEGGAYFQGLLDEVRLWSRALGPEEIAALHAYYRPSVIAHWSFDRDLTGEAGLPYPGTSPLGVTMIGDARIGQALYFDGAGQRVIFDMPEVFAGTYSAEAWFRTNPTGAIQTILNREDGLARASIHVWVDDAKLSASVRGDDLVEVSAAIEGQFADDCWHHVVVVREGADLEPGSVKLYVDGVALAIGTGTFGVTAVENAPFVIGYRRDDDPRPFAGKIDEVRIFDRALTADEVRGIYQIAE